MKYINLILVVCVMFVMASCEDRKKASEDDENTTSVVDDNESAENDQADNSEAIENLPDSENEVTNDVKEETPKPKYYVIVGSFKDVENAKKRYNELVEKCTESKVMEPFKDFNRVSYKVYDTKEEALKELNKVKTTEKQKDAWILTK